MPLVNCGENFHEFYKQLYSHYMFGGTSGWKKRSILLFTIFLSLFILSGCGPQNGTQRPDDAVLRKVIHQLMNNYGASFPKLQSWDEKKVDAQLKRELPRGFQTEAGWYLEWKDYTEGELAFAYAPWFLLGQYPENLQPQNFHYSGGNDVPVSTMQAVRAAAVRAKAIPSNEYFSAFVNVRSSTVDKRWIIFETVPYLPVTDPAYGFVEAVDGRWKFVDFGTATVGCGEVPAQVLSEFKLSCP